MNVSMMKKGLTLFGETTGSLASRPETTGSIASNFLFGGPSSGGGVETSGSVASSGGCGGNLNVAA